VESEGKGRYRLRWTANNKHFELNQMDFQNIKEIIEDKAVYKKRGLLSKKISHKMRFRVVHTNPDLSMDFKSQAGPDRIREATDWVEALRLICRLEIQHRLEKHRVV